MTERIPSREFLEAWGLLLGRLGLGGRGRTPVAVPAASAPVIKATVPPPEALPATAATPSIVTSIRHAMAVGAPRREPLTIPEKEQPIRRLAEARKPQIQEPFVCLTCGTEEMGSDTNSAEQRLCTACRKAILQRR